MGLKRPAKGVTSMAAPSLLTRPRRPTAEAWMSYAALSAGALALFFADPMFGTVGFPEIAGVAGLSIPIMVALARREEHRINLDSGLLSLLSAYLIYMIFSTLIGAETNGTSRSIIRSIAPIIAPVLAWVVVLFRPSDRIIKGGIIACVAAGIAQSLFCFNLFFNQPSTTDFSVDDYAARLTYFDWRPLHPFVLVTFAAGTALTLKVKSGMVLGSVLCVISFIAIAMTQTRTLMLDCGLMVIFTSIMIFAGKGVTRKEKRLCSRRIGVALVGAILLSAFFYATSATVRGVFEAILNRFNSPLNRVDSDWAPALSYFLGLGPLGVFFGGGLGSSYDSPDLGSAVTFVHSLLLYNLVFMGMVGVVLVSLVMGTIYFRLYRNYQRTGSVWWLMMLTTHVALLFYSASFAIYKWPSYNFILGLLIVGAAVRVPRLPSARPARNWTPGYSGSFRGVGIPGHAAEAL